MKTLPDNPHLHHLRQQAKELLAGLRDVDPTATLADAQASLAGQYGFRTWPELRAEVDRMRGRADTTDPALAQAIADRFGLGTVAGPMRSLARPDDIGRRWSVSTDRGSWQVRTMDTWWPIVDAQTDTALQLAAAAAGVLLPAPVRSRTGEIIESIGGHRWRAYHQLPAGPPLAPPVSAAVAHSVGGVLAAIHGLELPVDRISPWHAVRLSKVSWADLAAATTATTRTAAAGTWPAALQAAVPNLVDLDSIGRDEPAPEPVLTHNTLGPAQTRLDRDGRLVVLGWEHAGGQPPAWELANALLDWTVDPAGQINVAGVRALVAGYQDRAGRLPALELASFRGALTSLANYVFDQVQAASARDADDPKPEDRRYAERSVRHVLSRLPTRTTLERLLNAVA
ncbi:Ser/Thr protein kinase RdoA (MazF antagonist) [Micromonospora sp. Llam0]|uniref:phosphotransferase n=1 Tax=Micromonospora sp. Llam0 TaxID=2485143 RepID=UPI000F4A796F|nr:phosphotransferase [Micromonospora sp. Llam0]ROO59361.1 Ser/Thr protein kinase RdoA (MazF antagonist) [Micromonospora sp. Llam0]